MAKGGYTIVDLGKYNFTVGTAHKVPGIFNKVYANYGKPCLLTGIVIGSTPQDDQWMNVQVAGGGYVGLIAGYSLTIASNDNVTIGYYLPLNPPTRVPSANGEYTLKGTKSSTGFTYDWVKDT